MKRRVLIVSFLSFVLCILCIGSAAAQSKIGFVDSQKILTEFAAAIDAQKKLDDENNDWSLEMKKMNDELRSFQDQLDQQSLLLSSAKKKEKENNSKLGDVSQDN